MPSARPTRLYVGNLHRDTNERQIRQEFQRYGDLKDILMKQNYCFVEFRSERDAQEALMDLDGVLVHGRRWAVEETRRPPKADRSRSRSRGRRDRYRSRSRERYSRRYRSRSRGRSRRDRSRPRYRGSPRRGRERRALARGDFAVEILGIARSTSWQDLKDWARKAGNSVVFGDIIKQNNRVTGLIEYKYKKDQQNALDSLHQTELQGKTVYVYEKGKAPSITPSASPLKRSASTSKSRSRSRSVRNSNSKSRSHSRSASQSKSKSRSKSPDVKKETMEEEKPDEMTEDVDEEMKGEESAKEEGETTEADVKSETIEGSPRQKLSDDE